MMSTNGVMTIVSFVEMVKEYVDKMPVYTFLQNGYRYNENMTCLKPYNEYLYNQNCTNPEQKELKIFNFSFDFLSSKWLPI